MQFYIQCPACYSEACGRVQELHKTFILLPFFSLFDHWWFHCSFIHVPDGELKLSVVVESWGVLAKCTVKWAPVLDSKDMDSSCDYTTYQIRQYMLPDIWVWRSVSLWIETSLSCLLFVWIWADELTLMHVNLLSYSLGMTIIPIS